MSWKTSKRVWDFIPPSVVKNERLALLALAERADEYGVCWPGYDDIGRMVGVDPRSAIRLVEKLEKSGQVVVLRQMGMKGGRGYTNLYFIVTGLSSEVIKETITNHPMLKDKGDKIYTLCGIEKGDNFDKKGDKTYQKGDNFDKKGDIAVSPEPSIEPPFKPSLEPSFSENSKISPKKIEPGPLTDSILVCCSLELEMLLNGSKDELSDTIKRFTRKKTQPQEVLDFRRWWDEFDWRGQKGQPPTLKQLCECWPSFKNGDLREERRNGHNQSRKGNQPLRRTGEDLAKEPTFDPYTNEYILPTGERVKTLL